ncbi:hypothetical protein [Winogradskyella jejuensis]|uniref:Uncharacterized protein n=1 Tax=Winogradskyella jejuensis TaxID=1089305 RepID=A0A1M5UMA1_9FLAO|nr:hypothetical protein [Winogradskyella jejuensis]SHH64152.1 hypothetical protein SAMN05444148_2532 [Winogradskyella jejuensis]
MIKLLTTLLYDWTNGVIMISVFALVVFILVGVLINFMASGKKDKASDN